MTYRITKKKAWRPTKRTYVHQEGFVVKNGSIVISDTAKRLKREAIDAYCQNNDVKWDDCKHYCTVVPWFVEVTLVKSTRRIKPDGE